MTTCATQRQYLKTLARLRRVNKQIAAWDELEAGQLLPPSLRPNVHLPMLARDQLASLRAMLTDHLEELEARYRRG